MAKSKIQNTNQQTGNNPIIPVASHADFQPTGFPSPAMDYMEDEISLDKELIKNKLSTFFFIVTNDAMIGAYIITGSILIVDRSLTAKDGDIIIAPHEGVLIVRRLQISLNKCRLLPENDQYKPIEIAEEGLEVWGVVIHVVTTLNPTAYVRFG